MPEYILEFGDIITETDWTTAHHGADPSRFFARFGWCPGCQQNAPVVHADSKDDVNAEDSIASRYYGVEVCQCSCGWWDLQSTESTGSSSTEGWTEWLSTTHAILKRFDVSQLDVPLDLLRRELANRPGILEHVHSRKMEELVGAVFRDFYPGCEVHHCGRSHDGGIDLVLILSNSPGAPVAVQVKRRVRHDRGEPVSAVREFLGAMQIQGFSRGIYVTTADRFSRDARSDASRVLQRGAVAELELFDRQRFFSMLGVIRPKMVQTWRQYMPPEFRSV
jgi:restriction system protein